MAKKLQRSPQKNPFLVSAEQMQETIDNYLDGNILRFLRNHFKQSHYQLAYSVLIPYWQQKNIISNRAVRWLLKKTNKPYHVVCICNILITLEEYYNYRVNTRTMKIAYEIWDRLDDPYISPYISKRRNRVYTQYGNRMSLRLPTREDAWQEQLARGFVHVNDFEEFDKKAGHIYSNIKRDFIYPMNFNSGIYRLPGQNQDNYGGGFIYGVRGWTRAHKDIQI